jgi:hypothetical protein
MKGIKARAFFGIMGLTAAGLLASSASTVGCSDDGGTGQAGSSGGGTTGQAGSSGGGSTGQAGSGSGGTGTAACAAAAAAITDFGSGTAAVGTPYTYAETGLTAPTTSTTSGALVITVSTGMPSSMYPYVGVGLPFNACVNASTFTGVKFNATGTLSAGCTIQFSVVDKHHSTVANGGICTAASCYPSAKTFTVPATATDVTVLFSEHTGGGADTGAPVIDPTQILNIQWQINPAGGTAAAACTGMVTIDNITFI